MTVIFSKLKTLVVHTVLSDTTKDCYNMTLLLTPIHHVTLYIFVARLCEYVSGSKLFSFYSVRALDQRKKRAHSLNSHPMVETKTEIRPEIQLQTNVNVALFLMIVLHFAY